MEELIKLVSQKTGLSEEMSKVAVQTVVDYLKKQLPGPIAGQIDAALSGSGGLGGQLSKGLGGLLGND